MQAFHSLHFSFARASAYNVYKEYMSAEPREARQLPKDKVCQSLG